MNPFGSLNSLSWRYQTRERPSSFISLGMSPVYKERRRDWQFIWKSRLGINSGRRNIRFRPAVWAQTLLGYKHSVGEVSTHRAAHSCSISENRNLIANNPPFIFLLLFCMPLKWTYVDQVGINLALRVLNAVVRLSGKRFRINFLHLLCRDNDSTEREIGEFINQRFLTSTIKLGQTRKLTDSCQESSFPKSEWFFQAWIPRNESQRTGYPAFRGAKTQCKVICKYFLVLCLQNPNPNTESKKRVACKLTCNSAERPAT